MEQAYFAGLKVSRFGKKSTLKGTKFRENCQKPISIKNSLELANNTLLIAIVSNIL